LTDTAGCRPGPSDPASGVFAAKPAFGLEPVVDVVAVRAASIQEEAVRQIRDADSGVVCGIRTARSPADLLRT
jgi:hypothetical protein